MLAWVIVVASIIPRIDEPVYVDMIEINTVSRPVCAPWGKVESFRPAFDQVILWRWHGGSHRVAQWRLVGNHDGNGNRIGEQTFTVRKICRWHHVECWSIHDNHLRWEMKTKVIRSTGGTVDPERENAKDHAESYRQPYF